MALRRATSALLQHHFMQLSRCASSAAAPGATTALIKELREKSGAPISDVKSCLQQANWEVDAAYDLLRKKGLAAAAKKASRLAAEGLLGLHARPGLAAVVEINSETDFVPRNQLFKDLVTSVTKAAAELPSTAVHAGFEVDLDTLQQAVVPGTSVTVKDMCASVAAQVRENVQLRRAFMATSSGVVGTYVHNSSGPGLGNIVSIITLEQPGAQEPLPPAAAEQATQLANSLAMHAVGKRALYVNRQAIPEEVMQKERKLLAEQAQASGKGGKFVDKIVEGRLSKWMEEVCLVDQKYLLDDSVKVSKLLQDLSKQLGLAQPLVPTALLRVQCGEGLRDADSGQGSFAEEVAKIVQG